MLLYVYNKTARHNVDMHDCLKFPTYQISTYSQYTTATVNFYTPPPPLHTLLLQYLNDFLEFLLSFSHVNVELGSTKVGVVEGVGSPGHIPQRPVTNNLRGLCVHVSYIPLLRCCYAKYMPYRTGLVNGDSYCTAVSPPSLLCTGTWSSLSESLSACKAGYQLSEADLERFSSGWLLPRELITP